jgi:glutamine amidotransferase
LPTTATCKVSAPNCAVSPVGQTDSELAFCYLMETLRRRFPDGEPPRRCSSPPFARSPPRSAAHGEFNFLLSNGTCLFAHCASRLTYIVRRRLCQRPPEGSGHHRGFQRTDHPDDRVAVVATTPLTDNEAGRRSSREPDAVRRWRPRGRGPAATCAFIRAGRLRMMLMSKLPKVF